MKSILYAGAALMIGASIYGVVDYNNSSHKKEFTSMYETHEETPVVTTKDEKPIDEKIPGVTKKTSGKKAAVKSEFVPIQSKSKEFVTPVEAIEVKTDATVKTDELKETKSVKVKSTKSKKLNHKLFSRGSLEDRYVEKTLKVEDPKAKKEPKKTTEKEL